MSTDTHEPPDASAVLKAISEHDEVDPKAFHTRYEGGEGDQYHLQHGDRLYSAKAIAGAAYDFQPPPTDPARAGASISEIRAAAALRTSGFTVLNGRPATVEEELGWRLVVWKHLLASSDADGLLTSYEVRSVRAFGGQQGIWTDKARTKHIHHNGLGVALKHTGTDYPDTVTEESALYRYPDTKRSGQDQTEILATKTAAKLGLPIFLISERGNRRLVKLGWVAGWEDRSGQFYVTFGPEAPTALLTQDRSDEQPFVLEGNRRGQRTGKVPTRPDQAQFKLEVFQRYGPTCPLSGLAVPEMIEAAHLRPSAKNGTSDPRNGLPLNAALHRAFDADLFAIHPDTREILVRPQGPTLAQLGIIKTHLDGLDKYPHRDALAWRHTQWLEKNKPTPTKPRRRTP
ncbi:HNH endonuclease signature motif containing protein [Kitasatospora sp. NPDC096128]|uniref:HNH endonuclease n=1 Tax=Kitasatospora sp. NPDC096128 TaxID=3155547 RepID=UPI0033179B31